MKIAKIGKILRDRKAVSPVISVLLMVSIAVVAALITYTWVTGFVGTTTVKAGHAIQIQGVKFTNQSSSDNNRIIIYVQNVGDGTVELVDTVFINGGSFQVYNNETCGSGQEGWDGVSDSKLSEGSIATGYIKLESGQYWVEGNEYTIRVVCTDGTFTEGKFIAPME